MGDWYQTKQMDGTTLAQFEKLCASGFTLREEIQEKERELSELKTARAGIQDHILHILNEHGKKNYRSEYGMVSIAQKLSVKQPKEPDAKKAFFDYLKEKGIFEDLVSVHSQTLQAFYKTEWELAKDKDPKARFTMPGIGEPVYFEQLQMRKG